MGYSITFGTSGNSRNTWTNWRLIPESPPTIPSPTPKTNYVDIPGRSKGPLDMTKVPFNRQTYERITGSWTFAMYEDYWYTPNRAAIFESCRSWLHGRSTRMSLEEDPGHLFYGRFTVSPPSRGEGPGVLQIGFDLEPVRYLSNGEIDTSWLSDVTEWIDAHITPIPDSDIHALFT